MKNLITLRIVVSMLCLSGCSLFGSTVGSSLVYDIVANSQPTKVTTEVSYVTIDGDTLNGFYTTTVSGSDTIFEYEYQRLATPEESIKDGNTDRVKTINGVIYYHDGVYSYGDNTEWKPGSGSAIDIKLNIKEEYLKNIQFNEDGTVLTANVTPENAVEVLGTDIRAVDDLTLVVETNGVNLTLVTISCTTSIGDLAIRTSYTYNAQDLFPESDAQ